MKKEKTLNEKRISWYEEGIFFYNGKVSGKFPLVNGDKIFREKDVKQFIKEILKEIEKRKGYSNDIDNEMMELEEIIKRKSGFIRI